MFFFIKGFIQQGNAVGGQPRPPNHIITRPQMAGAPIQWMQQQVNKQTNLLQFMNHGGMCSNTYIIQTHTMRYYQPRASCSLTVHPRFIFLFLLINAKNM